MAAFRQRLDSITRCSTRNHSQGFFIATIYVYNVSSGFDLLELIAGLTLRSDSS